MKNTVVKRFCSSYTDKNTGFKMNREFYVTIIYDTANEKYRILNLTYGSIWKEQAFATFQEACNFLENNSDCVKNFNMEIPLGQEVVYRFI